MPQSVATSSSEQLRDAILQGRASEIVSGISLDELPDLIASVTELAPGPADEVLELLWRAHSTIPMTLAAALRIAPDLPLARNAEWSARLRAMDFESLCPLIAKASDAGLATSDRVAAASAAWQRFFDERARHLLAAIGAPPVSPVPAYYRHRRPEITKHVPLAARRILDLGCAAGRLGASLRDRQPCEVVGIEQVEAVASYARDVLDEVVIGDLDGDALDRVTGAFDAIIAADVLEHVRDPWAATKRLVSLLRPGGVLVLSVPNLANLRILSELAEGRFDYQDDGILDRTHIRFFTAATATEMLSGAGLSIESVTALADAELVLPAVVDGALAEISFGRLRISPVSAQEAAELAALQFVVVGRRRDQDAATSSVEGPGPGHARQMLTHPSWNEEVPRSRRSAHATSSVRRPEIWDCVPFFNELDLLEARLEELDGIVDHAVVVEADRTHRGAPKPLCFKENRDRFSRFEIQIHHVVAQLPEHAAPWTRERLQRDAALPALSFAAPDDVILSCDLDELVRREAVEEIIEGTVTGPVRLQMPLYYYSLDWRSPELWAHAKALRARDLPTSLTSLRLLGITGRSDLPTVEDAGWHLSYFGGESKVHETLLSFAHAEHDTTSIHEGAPDLIARGRTVNGVDLEFTHDAFPAHIEARFGATRRSEAPRPISTAPPTRVARHEPVDFRSLAVDARPGV